VKSPELFFPQNEAELSDWLRARRSEAGPIVTGANDVQTENWQPGGFVANEHSLVSTARMAEVISFRPRDLTIEVGAGMRVERLRKFVEDEGLWSPMAGIGTIRSVGGWIAAASPGMWDASHGPVRRQLLGCRVVAPGGTDLTWGRAVMKNVAGYDVPRLMAGSRGRLGIMTRVTIRLWPRPEAISAWEIRGEEQPFVLGASEADTIIWSWTREEGASVRALFLGSTRSVQRRERTFATRVRALGAQLLEIDASREPSSGRGGRQPGSVVYRLTPGRGYLSRAFTDLVEQDRPGLAAIEAIPDSGSLLLFMDTDSSHPDRVRELLSHVTRTDARTVGGAVRRPQIGIERGSSADHEAANDLRAPGMREIESRIERALGAWPRSWQADYL
jgi:FAD/FMN-containing dehydrogenase